MDTLPQPAIQHQYLLTLVRKWILISFSAAISAWMLDLISFREARAAMQHQYSLMLAARR
eukprot:1873968-Karenia_brevis.AAC.1